jgi:nucleotide-binding universal stress UspA family protein
MNTQKKDLLIPVDFKLFSLKAIDFAKRIKEQVKGTIHLFHVVESQSWWSSYFNEKEILLQAKEKLERIKNEQNLPQDTVLEVAMGTAHEQAIKYAKLINARFIVLSDNYPLSKGVTRLGSTVSQVIMRAERPVITLTEKEDSVFKNVLIPLDLNQSCRMQLYGSIAMALNHSSKLHIVSVVNNEEQLKLSRIHNKIEKFKKAYEDNSIDYSVKLLIKEEQLAYKEILNYAHNNSMDSILIMTHNESVRYDNYLGAFAHHIINEATMPVVSINNASAKSWESKLSTSYIDPFGIITKK